MTDSAIAKKQHASTGLPRVAFLLKTCREREAASSA
jgi:hypothetical protein